MQRVNVVDNIDILHHHKHHRFCVLPANLLWYDKEYRHGTAIAKQRRRRAQEFTIANE